MAETLTPCWECKQPVGVTAKRCPHYGADLHANPALLAKGCFYIGGLFMAVVLIGMIISLFS